MSFMSILAAAETAAPAAAQTTTTVVADGAAAAPGAAAQPQPNMLTGMLPIIIVFAVMIFFMMRSQKKQAQKRQQMIDQVVKGTRVLLNSGMYGTIVEVKSNSFVVEIADRVQVEVFPCRGHGYICRHCRSRRGSEGSRPEGGEVIPQSRIFS